MSQVTLKKCHLLIQCANKLSVLVVNNTSTAKHHFLSDHLQESAHWPMGSIERSYEPVYYRRKHFSFSVIAKGAQLYIK